MLTIDSHECCSLDELFYVAVNSIGVMMKFQTFEFANLARVSSQGIHADYIKNQW